MLLLPGAALGLAVALLEAPAGTDGGTEEAVDLPLLAPPFPIGASLDAVELAPETGAPPVAADPLLWSALINA